MKLTNPRLSLVAAMTTPGRVIGRGLELPWRLPEDMKHFRRLTLGKPVIMGRKVHQGIGRPLPGRHNIVLTRDHAYEARGCTLVYTPGDALQAAGDAPEIMVIGGAEVYSLYLDQVSRMYLTLVHTDLEGDTFFPPAGEAQVDLWKTLGREFRPKDEHHAYDMTFLTLARA
ncbi:dihydrofolate reductase [Deinococcus hopiensis]|uniref:Dihydrofolate reductase n=1 Tax=Deinococcus hopiensis KR-140 TaxID=695939 RepID=A0A1W1UTY7_9DEIO|nr:dihydrofolate reductase [Deinococcus hopiensis]SMB84523.1 dihydrofolate reductase [Deinococcus hopiensis KR-140]